jgi:cytidylate kinase
MRQLASLINCDTSGQKLSDLITNATVYIGPAGSGKSTIIKQSAKTGDLVIAMTTEAVLRVKDLQLPCQCRSLEYATTFYNSDIDTLFIDEASQINYL